MALFFLGAFSLRAADGGWISEQGKPGDFALVQNGHAADFLVSPDDFTAVGLAAVDLAGDVERVTGSRPTIHPSIKGLGQPAVLIGTLGRNFAIDSLVKRGLLDVSALRGQWETFMIATVKRPLPGVEVGLVVVGSDRRGTAYGVYELSQAVGVSPWHWWADVAPDQKTALFVAAGVRKFGPPSVKYRGIFINDEDWGLQPWAAKTFAPEEKGIGPKTYKKIFELLLRLKANTLWPAMHACSPPFNAFPANAQLADDYGIVMGSSHAEPMLRNNVSEWKAPAEDYDYVKNREGVKKYWDDRLATNGHFENIYTIGMRGIHDSGMVGPKSDAERIHVLEQVFADQRAMLAARVNPAVEQVPQVFCAYKEVLDLYRQGLHVPADVTIMWPDDNFGYIRNYAAPDEQSRPGGYGIYYHLSYLGKPLSYLWLSTTPPALIWSEMTKAYAHGADRIWIANVGDLKPAEIDTEFFLQLAWDVKRWRADQLDDFLADWARREFGPEAAREIAAIMAGYYHLNFERKPEHLQWWLPGEKPRPSALSTQEIDHRLTAFADLVKRTERVGAQLPAEKQAAFYELVAYPVRGSALANQRYFYGETGRANDALAADAELKAETRRYNEDNAGGKWRHLLSLEPADAQWSSMRIEPWTLQDFSIGQASTLNLERTPLIAGAIKPDRSGARWTAVSGLGKSGGALTLLPTTGSPLSLIAATEASQVEYAFTAERSGAGRLVFSLLPTHPLAADRGLRFAYAVDDGTPRLAELTLKDGGMVWARGVLDESLTLTIRLTITQPGRHILRLYALEAGVVIDRVIFQSPP